MSHSLTALSQRSISPPRPSRGIEHGYIRVLSDLDEQFQSVELSKQPFQLTTSSIARPEIRELANTMSRREMAAYLKKEEKERQANLALDTRQPPSPVGYARTNSTLRPASATLRGTTTTKSKRPGSARPSSASSKTQEPSLPKSGESYPIDQIQRLEAEVAHLRSTLSSIMVAEGATTEEALQVPPIYREPNSAIRPSGVRLSNGTLSSNAPLYTDKDHAALAVGVYRANMSIPGVVSALNERKERERAILALRQESQEIRGAENTRVPMYVSDTRDALSRSLTSPYPTPTYVPQAPRAPPALQDRFGTQDLGALSPTRGYAPREPTPSSSGAWAQFKDTKQQQQQQQQQQQPLQRPYSAAPSMTTYTTGPASPPSTAILRPSSASGAMGATPATARQSPWFRNTDKPPALAPSESGSGYGVSVARTMYSEGGARGTGAGYSGVQGPAPRLKASPAAPPLATLRQQQMQEQQAALDTSQPMSVAEFQSKKILAAASGVGVRDTSASTSAVSTGSMCQGPAEAQYEAGEGKRDHVRAVGQKPMAAPASMTYIQQSEEMYQQQQQYQQQPQSVTSQAPTSQPQDLAASVRSSATAVFEAVGMTPKKSVPQEVANGSRSAPYQPVASGTSGGVKPSVSYAGSPTPAPNYEHYDRYRQQQEQAVREFQERLQTKGAMAEEQRLALEGEFRRKTEAIEREIMEQQRLAEEKKLEIQLMEEDQRRAQQERMMAGQQESVMDAQRAKMERQLEEKRQELMQQQQHLQQQQDRLMKANEDVLYEQHMRDRQYAQAQTPSKSTRSSQPSTPYGTAVAARNAAAYVRSMKSPSSTSPTPATANYSAAPAVPPSARTVPQSPFRTRSRPPLSALKKEATTRPSTATGPPGQPLRPPPVMRPRSASEKPSRKELEEWYAANPDVVKSVRETTETQEFHFTDNSLKAMSIREAKIWQDVERKRKEEEDALKYQFKAQPIAETTRNIGLFRKIMEKQEERRRMLHEQKEKEINARFKPFETVTKHTDEHMSRMAARRAKAEIELTNELSDARKFKANPIPASITKPDIMYENLMKREAERASRVSAHARASYAAASLPPRMALAEETDRKKRSERIAQHLAKEREDAMNASFRANEIPDFDILQNAFEKSLRDAKASIPLTDTNPFGFDQPERVKAEVARKEVFSREYELETARSKDLRRISKAYHEGAELVNAYENPNPSPRPFTGGLAGTFGGDTAKRLSLTQGGTLGRTRPHSAMASTRLNDSNLSIGERLSKNRAPPASMTRSTQLKMLESQKRIKAMQEAELLQEKKEEEYRQRMREANERYQPVFRKHEMNRRARSAAARGKPIEPFSWEMDNVTSTASRGRKEFEATSREREALNRSRVLTAQENRPLIMLRSTMNTTREEGRRTGLINTAKGIASGVHRSRRTASTEGGSEYTARMNESAMSWLEIAERGVEGTEIFSDDDRDLMMSNPIEAVDYVPQQRYYTESPSDSVVSQDLPVEVSVTEYQTKASEVQISEENDYVESKESE